MTDLEWPTWDADRYTYRIMSPSFIRQMPDGERRPYDAWGELQIVTHEFLHATGFSRSQLRSLLVRPVLRRVEQETGRLLDEAEIDVALIDDRFPGWSLARDVQGATARFANDLELIDKEPHEHRTNAR